MAGCLSVMAAPDMYIHVLPDTAQCKCTEVSPLDMDECPLHKFDWLGMECWPEECDKYTEADT